MNFLLQELLEIRLFNLDLSQYQDIYRQKF